MASTRPCLLLACSVPFRSNGIWLLVALNSNKDMLKVVPNFSTQNLLFANFPNKYGEAKKSISNTFLFLLQKKRNCSPTRIILPETSRRKGDQEGRSGAYFYAQRRSICQLLGDVELGWWTIEECFFLFFKKGKDEEDILGSVGDTQHLFPPFHKDCSFKFQILCHKDCSSRNRL